MTVTKMAMGIDFSTLALNVTYGLRPEPYRLKFDLGDIDHEDRLIEVAEVMDKLLEQIEIQWPDLVLSIMVIEKPWFGSNKQTVITLTQVQAACIVSCARRKWYVVQEDPSKIRKKVIGVGSSTEKGEIKKLAQKWVEEHHGVKLDDNASDSVVIWEYAQWLVENANG
jgi:Holliday junction resolvasome RuvABC endonuclease subunit